MLNLFYRILQNWKKEILQNWKKEQRDFMLINSVDHW